MNSLFAQRHMPLIRRTAAPKSARISLRQRILDKVWRRAMTRRGYAWLSDSLSCAAPLCSHTPLPDRSRGANAWDSEDREGAMLMGTGNSLAAQLDAIDSNFVKDILVRRASCAMAQLHQMGGYLGFARAEHMEVRGNDVGFVELDCDECDSLSIPTAQTRDWLLFTASVAPHYDDRPNDLAAILFRAMRVLPHASCEELRRTADSLAALEHPWCRLLGPHMKAMRTAVLAIRIRYAWQAAPASSIHALPTRPSQTLLRYLNR